MEQKEIDKLLYDYKEQIALLQKDIATKQNELNKLKETLFNFCIRNGISINITDVDFFILICCRAVDMDHEEVRKKHSNKKVVTVRHVILHLIYRKYNLGKQYLDEKKNVVKSEGFLTLKQIGSRFLGRKGNGLNHTTVLNSDEVVMSALNIPNSNPELAEVYKKINSYVSDIISVVK